MNDAPTTSLALTDEEWGELCFKVVELRQLHELLEDVLLDEQRPRFSEIWSKASAYQGASHDLFDYLACCIRGKIGIANRGR